MSDSSSTDPNDPPNDNNNNDHFAAGVAGNSNSILSDSDDRHAFAFKLRQTPMSGNFESDSLNENFSPSRPNIRRKRKFKRMAVEYETTPSTPHNASHPIFPISGTVKKRVFKHNQDNFRANLFFGKRKRPHRERYADYESYKHSSSVPRQRGGFLSQKDGGLSYSEYKSRNRASSMSTNRAATAIEKILPLNKSIVSKIEKISQDSSSKMSFKFTSMMPQLPQIDSTAPVIHFQSLVFRCPPQAAAMDTSTTNITDDSKINLQKMAQKSGSFESALPTNSNNNNSMSKKKKIAGYHTHVAVKHKQSRRLKLQFDDQNFMDCGNINDFLSSSSLSSSDSETEETNESDHEGDDELTDWPGHEVMVNFASKNEFKRINKKAKLPQIKQQDDIIQDDDTLMSADEIQAVTSEDSPVLLMNTQHDITTSRPINIVPTALGSFVPGSSSTSGVVVDGYGSSFATSYNHKTPNLVESEMSGETSNHFLSSPNNTVIGEVREIRAGCRRIREERPGFSIITSFNEDLLK
jgi:G patch domain-containing protein 2